MTHSLINKPYRNGSFLGHFTQPYLALGSRLKPGCIKSNCQYTILIKEALRVCVCVRACRCVCRCGVLCVCVRVFVSLQLHSASGVYPVTGTPTIASEHKSHVGEQDYIATCNPGYMVGCWLYRCLGVFLCEYTVFLFICVDVFHVSWQWKVIRQEKGAMNHGREELQWKQRKKRGSGLIVKTKRFDHINKNKSNSSLKNIINDFSNWKKSPFRELGKTRTFGKSF